MIKKPIRVLHIVSVMNHGGIENFIMNIYRKIDRSLVQFDFLVTREEKGIFDDEIKHLGGEIFNIEHIKKVGFVKYKKSVVNFFKSNDGYKIIHCHMNTWSGFFLQIANGLNIPVRIAHSHSSQKGFYPKRLADWGEYYFKKFMKSKINSNATHFFSCGYEAGDWLFGKRIADNNMKIINNGVDTSKIKYNSDIEKKVRESLNISLETLVIGHVGNMNPVKNHKFLIEIFQAVNKKVPNSILCLVGDGQLRKDIEGYIQNVGLIDKVKILGIRNDVNDLLKAFNVFMLPSKFEGLPVSIIEAQAAALPCIISDNITSEVDMGLGLVTFVGLEKSPEEWANVVLDHKNQDRNISINSLIKLGYDSETTAKWLQKFYLNFNSNA